ncbi:hypothetical protein S245_000512, partial [Arachis hypogaea]
ISTSSSIHWAPRRHSSSSGFRSSPSPNRRRPLLDPHIKEAFDVSFGNIYAFHAAQKSPERSVKNMKGVQCKRVVRSINFVSLYVLGELLCFLQQPAQIVGFKTIVLAAPPTQDGNICKAEHGPDNQ